MRAPAMLALTASLLAGGCLPHVGHGPRVEPGRTWSMNGSFSHAPQLQDEQVSIMPTLYVGLFHGWTFDSGLAASVGVQAPPLALPFLFLGGFEFDAWSSLLLGDLYVQPRQGERDDLQYGVGLMASRHIAAPYVQFGKADDGGLYTTQMIARTHSGLNNTLYWLPSVAHRTVVPGSSRAVDFYVAGGVGWLEDPPEWRRDQRDWYVSAGVLVELRPRPDT